MKFWEQQRMKLWKWIVSDRSKAQLIFVGACVLSYTHTLNLFQRSGYVGVLAHIGTIICELLFLLGITSKTPNSRTRGALIFGGSIVLYSNVSFGLAKGKAIVFYKFPNGMELNEVFLCGILIPLLVWIAEWVRSHKEAKVTQSVSHTQPVTQSESHTGSHTDSHTDSRMRIQPQTLTQEHAVTQFDSQADSHSLKVAQYESQDNTHTSAKAETEDNKRTDKPSRSVNESHEEPSHTITQAHTDADSHTESHNMNESHAESSHTVTQVHTKDESHTNSHTKDDSHKDSHKEKDSHTESVSHNDAQANVRELAVRMYEQDGKLPSIRKLAEVAGCSEWQSRKALQELKKKIS